MNIFKRLKNNPNRKRQENILSRNVVNRQDYSKGARSELGFQDDWRTGRMQGGAWGRGSKAGTSALVGTLPSFVLPVPVTR